MRTRVRSVLIAYVIAALINLPSCAPNRGQWMSQAANQQAKVATDQIGTVEDVKAQARQAAQLLNGLSAAALNKPPGGNQQVAQAFADDVSEVSSGLQAIAESRTDAAFTNAVFGMCDASRQAACPRVGRVMMGIAAGIRTNPPSNLNPDQKQAAIQYFETFGGRLINIPTQCVQASKAMVAADTEEQQAEVAHQANVNRALTAAAIVFAGTVVYASAVGAAAATRPPVVQNNFYNSQFYGY
ncbi:MAG: hypothetical protein JO121_19265 [Deltaproteobacteria bacterium]|nr:hypothetical protein [Deltaproteobacteria bacterium]